MTAAQPPAGIRNNPGNITAQADGKPRYAGEIGSWVGPTSGLTYAIFDSREMGLRAMFREFTTKLQRHKGDVELAILEYLGGGREGTKEDRIKRARRHNDDPEPMPEEPKRHMITELSMVVTFTLACKVWSHGQYWKKINRSIETGI